MEITIQEKRIKLAEEASSFTKKLVENIAQQNDLSVFHKSSYPPSPIAKEQDQPEYFDLVPKDVQLPKVGMVLSIPARWSKVGDETPRGLNEEGMSYLWEGVIRTVAEVCTKENTDGKKTAFSVLIPKPETSVINKQNEETPQILVYPNVLGAESNNLEEAERISSEITREIAKTGMLKLVLEYPPTGGGWKSLEGKTGNIAFGLGGISKKLEGYTGKDPYQVVTRATNIIPEARQVYRNFFIKLHEQHQHKFHQEIRDLHKKQNT